MDSSIQSTGGAPAELWLLPAPFDFLEDNWRATCITFLPGASASETASDLFELACDFDVQRCDRDFEPSYEDVDLGSCLVRFETDASAETTALLLYRAAYLIRSSGIPRDSDLIVLSDPTVSGRHLARLRNRIAAPPSAATEACPFAC